MVLNATFNNISVISWRSVLLVEETKLPRENDRPVVRHWQALSYNVVSIYLGDEYFTTEYGIEILHPHSL